MLFIPSGKRVSVENEILFINFSSDPKLLEKPISLVYVTVRHS